MLVNLPSPIPEFYHTPLPPKCCESKNVPELIVVLLFHFKLTYECIKEFGNTSLGPFNIINPLMKM